MAKQRFRKLTTSSVSQKLLQAVSASNEAIQFSPIAQ
jgi:hypothetical protein